MVELIAPIIAQRRNQGIEGEDFLQALMNASYEGSSINIK
jgi:cytochrome P450